MSPASEDSRAEALRLTVVAGRDGVDLDGEWASDKWDATRLGVPARRGRGRARFDTISHDWLREPAKRWCRFRLATGCAFATINAGALALSRFSWFLAARHPQVTAPCGITRPVLEDYLAWLLTKNYSASTRALTLSMLRVFFDACLATPTPLRSHRRDQPTPPRQRRPPRTTRPTPRPTTSTPAQVIDSDMATTTKPPPHRALTRSTSDNRR